jgi:hypothetical protein
MRYGYGGGWCVPLMGSKFVVVGGMGDGAWRAADIVVKSGLWRISEERCD